MMKLSFLKRFSDSRIVVWEDEEVADALILDGYGHLVMVDEYRAQRRSDDTACIDRLLGVGELMTIVTDVITGRDYSLERGG